MAIDIPDPYGQGQQDVPLGRSQLPIRDTYGHDPRGINERYNDSMSNASKLFGAVSQLSESFNEKAKEQQSEIDKQALLQQDTMTTGADLSSNSGPGGVFSRLFPGAGSPDGSGLSAASPSVQATIAHNRGANDASSFFDKDADFTALTANRDLMNNPAALDTELTKLWNQKSQQINSPFAGTNLDGLYRGGVASGFMAYRRKLLGQSNADSINYQRGVAMDSGARWLNNNQSTITTQQSAYRGAADAGADPVKLNQFVAIENPNWHNHEVSSNGSVGITQINDARWDDIKAYLRKQGNTSAADALTDRTDPYQNALAWGYEYNRISDLAKNTLGRDPTTGEVYQYWIAPAYADKVLKNPDTKVSDLIPASIIRANPRVYGDGSETAGAMVNNVNRIMNADSGFHIQYQPSDRLPRQLVTRDTWQDNFTVNGYKWSDFKNSGVYGGDGQIDRRSIDALDQLSTFMGKKVGVTSAYRSEGYNDAVTGTTTRNHPSGDAMDVQISDPAEQRKAAQFLASIGARGIGAYNGHLHFDFGTGRPNQTKDVNTWSQGGLPLADLNAAVKDGRANMANGNYYRMTGFQGREIDPTEAKIQYLRQNYGIPPQDGRKMVLSSAVDSAYNKAYNGNAAGAQTDLAIFKQNFGSLSSAEELNLNEASQKINTIQQTIRERDEQQQRYDALQSENKYISAQVDKLTKDPHSQADAPNRADFPRTVAGQQAYSNALAASLNIIGVPDAVSNGNLIQANSEINGNPQQFAAKYGFSDWTKVSPEQMRRAIFTQTPGQYTPAHVNEIAANFEKARTGLPVAMSAAKNMAEVYKAEIHQAFTVNSDALKAITEANSNPATSGILATDPYRARDEIANYVGMTDQFFQQNYAARYRAAQAANGGQALSGDERNALAQQSITSTQLYAKSLANAIVANKADVGKTTEAAQTMLHPEAAHAYFDAAVAAATKKQYGNSFVATDIKLPGIPSGAFVELGANGLPNRMSDGSYKVFTPDGRGVFFYNPAYNVLPNAEYPPQGTSVPQPTPAAPAAPAPTSALPGQGVVSAIENSNAAQRLTQEDLPAIMEWLESSGVLPGLRGFNEWIMNPNAHGPNYTGSPPPGVETPPAPVEHSDRPGQRSGSKQPLLK